MFERSIVSELGQVAASEAGDIFRDWVRGEVRSLIVDLMAEEVCALCGPSHRPEPESGCRRWGTTPVSVRIDGVRAGLRRPRVRTVAAGSGGEVSLSSYTALLRADDLRERILRGTATGVSSRDQAELQGTYGTSRSEVSRLWIVEGRRRLEKLRERDLTAEAYFALILDGIRLSDDLTGIVAVGITLDGRKMVLDFEVGAQESAAVCDGLMGRLFGRGLTFAGPPLAVLDGSKALEKSLLAHVPEATIQRCLVHKERNIKACLSRRDHGEVTRLFKRLRLVEGKEAAGEVVGQLEAFLSERNRKACESLLEAGEQLLSLHALSMPSTLNVSLLSTNCIENSFRNVRAKTDRVKRWRAETDQAERWLAYALLTAEKGFRRIRGYRDIPVLLKALGWPAEAVEASLRSALGPLGHPCGDGLRSTTPQTQAGSEATCSLRTGQPGEDERQ